MVYIDENFYEAYNNGDMFTYGHANDYFEGVVNRIYNEIIEPSDNYFQDKLEVLLDWKHFVLCISILNVSIASTPLER